MFLVLGIFFFVFNIRLWHRIDTSLALAIGWFILFSAQRIVSLFYSIFIFKSRHYLEKNIISECFLSF